MGTFFANSFRNQFGFGLALLFSFICVIMSAEVKIHSFADKAHAVVANKLSNAQYRAQNHPLLSTPIVIDNGVFACCSLNYCSEIM
jgi:hypothetical protein